MATIRILMKHDDRCGISYVDGDTYVEMHSDYMPDVNRVLGGDETRLEIDNDTGRILNWTPVKIEDGKFVEE